MNDVQTMIQVIRLLTTFLTDWNNDNEDKKEDQKTERDLAKEIFIDFFKSELVLTQNEADDVSSNFQALIEKFFFILEQSLNSSLLDSTITFLFNLIDNDDRISTPYGMFKFVSFNCKTK